jgi:hypothetical protein
MIDNLAAAGEGRAVMKCAARADHVPNLACDAMHVYGKADPTITNERQPEFFFAHIHDVASHCVTRKR